MRIALLQYSPTPDLQKNKKSVLDFMERAASQGAGLVCTSDVCLSPFFPQHRGQDVSHCAMCIGDPVMNEFQQACRKLSLAASPNIYLREGGKFYDASLFIDADGDLLGGS